MPFDYGDKEPEEQPWPTDDLQAQFGLDEELKDAEDYVAEYDG
jgi:hypothetical protein